MSPLIKCLVWDLDHTIWSGTLMERDTCRLKPGIKNVLQELDRRGILLSIASANDQDLAIKALRQKGILEYFLHPQINWSRKVSSIQVIAQALRIGLNAIGFIDDEPYEREQVRQILPVVSTYPASHYRSLLERPEFNPGFRTRESSQRRRMYLQESVRAEAQSESGISYKEFLKRCRTRIRIGRAREDDLPRILELMHRTHQLNATGQIFDENEVARFLRSDQFRTYVAELQDDFVDYGKVGVAICACRPDTWHLFSFLLSCRILTRGIGYVFLSWLRSQAYAQGAKEFEGLYVKRERNHRMKMLYSLSGFRPKRRWNDGSIVFTGKCKSHFYVPEWLTLLERES